MFFSRECVRLFFKTINSLPSSHPGRLGLPADKSVGLTTNEKII